MYIEKQKLYNEIETLHEKLTNQFINFIEYLKLSYCMKHKSNTKVAIMRKIYKSGLFRIFLALYNFMINKLKIDIKW